MPSKAGVVELGFMFVMFDEARPSVLGPADSDNQAGRSPEVVSSFGQQPQTTRPFT